MASAHSFPGEAWDRTATAYSLRAAPFMARVATQLVELVHSELALDIDSNVLDLGAGTGAATFAVVRNHPSKVLATDVSEQMLQSIVVQQEPRVSARILDALEVGKLGSQTFSHVFSMFMLQFLLQPEVVVSGIHEVLKPGGVLGLALWHGRLTILVIWEKACQTIDPSYQIEKDYVDPHAWTTPEQVKRRLEEAKFEDVRVNKVVLPMPFPSAEAFVDYMANGNHPTMQHAMEQWKGDRTAALKVAGRICKEEYRDGQGYTQTAMYCKARKPLLGR